MKRNFFISLVLVILTALALVVTATAKPPVHLKPWYLHLAGQSGHYVCNRDKKDALGTFVSKQACEDAIPGDGDDGDGDGDGDGDTPPVIGADTPDNVFLCSNSFQIIPGVWPKDEAATLVGVYGYTEAQAVAGNVEGGENVGSYRLVCNSGLTDTGLAVDTAGELFGTDYGPADEELGFYALFA